MTTLGRILLALLTCLAVAQVGESTKWYYKKKHVGAHVSVTTGSKTVRLTKMLRPAADKLKFIKRKLEHIDSSSSSSSSSSEESNEGSRETFSNRDVRFLRNYGDVRHSSYARYLALVNGYYGQGYGAYAFLPGTHDAYDQRYTISAYNTARSLPPFCGFDRSWNASPFGYSSAFPTNYRYPPGRTNLRGVNFSRYSNIPNSYLRSRDVKYSYKHPAFTRSNQFYTAPFYGGSPYGPRGYTPYGLDYPGPYAWGPDSPSEFGIYINNFFGNRYSGNYRTDMFGRSLEGRPRFPTYGPPKWNFGLPNYYSGRYTNAVDLLQGEYDYLTSYNKFKFDRYGLYQLDLFKEFFHSLDQERFNIIKDIRYPADFTPHLQPDMVFDFIIVGAGPTGSLLANLLSQNYNWNVLLIEAGGHPPPAAEVPLLYSTLARSEFDWDFNLEAADAVGLGMRNQEIRVHMGKGLGGGALTLPDLYYRGCVRDYQSLVEAGLLEYSFPSLLRYFMKTEHLRSILMINDNEVKLHHGFGGPLPVSKITAKDYKYITNVYSAAFSQLGYHPVLDINDAKVNTGYVDMVGHVCTGRRMLPGKVFLSPIVQRENFKLLTNTHVTRILIDTNTNTAYGVELVTKQGQIFTVQASKEVIVTAGAIGSAQLLMLSGIGPRHQLLLHDIDLVKDLNVGGNLKLNAVFTGAVMAHEKALMRHTSVEDMAFDYLAHNDGPLATYGTFSHTVFMDTLTDGYPDVEFHSYYFNKGHHEWLCDFKAMYNYADEYRTKLAQLNDQHNLAVLSLTLLRPHSTGRVILESKNPFDRPIVVGNLLSDEHDVLTFLKALEKISLLEETEAFNEVGSKLVPIAVEECSAFPFKSPDYWKCALKYFTTAASKPTGTCKMGPGSDPSAVVDGFGRVYGINGLRVSGSAVLPDPLTAYSSAPLLMLAEKVAEHIMVSYTI
ncbi:unnamed protein product [Bemisia tabaci]|uniref:Glucose-methanol-choline oxidoreductase N-terminal domain-containing protein n=2 Tax=Bemisia tabaci TaxID=7038 RepID=A0A9P0A2W0_BEMTA|nr:unnamed protein product [Bemisia tabaci]